LTLNSIRAEPRVLRVGQRHLEPFVRLNDLVALDPEGNGLRRTILSRERQRIGGQRFSAKIVEGNRVIAAWRGSPRHRRGQAQVLARARDRESEQGRRIRIALGPHRVGRLNLQQRRTEDEVVGGVYDFSFKIRNGDNVADIAEARNLRVEVAAATSPPSGLLDSEVFKGQACVSREIDLVLADDEVIGGDRIGVGAAGEDEGVVTLTGRK